MAGLTLASLCIPQSIGYATLAKLARSVCPEETRGLDMSAKPKSQFVDLSQDFLQKSQCGCSNGNVSNLSETNKIARRGWLSYMYEGGNSGTDANCIPKFHQPEKLPSTSQQTSFMAGKPKQCQGILPPDSRMDRPRTEKNRSGNRPGGGNWLSVSQGICEDTSDLVSGFATIGDGLSESVDYPNDFWDSDEYDDDDDVGYMRQPIEDETWFLAHEIDYPRDNEKGA